MSEPTLTGKMLGRYQILDRIGAGGMGEVYRARDIELLRDVAVKVMPASANSDPDRLRRFKQEAQATSALNHPNILAIYDIGEYEGSPYAVSELLEGQTLRDQMAGAELSVRKAIEYGVQISCGLSAAHEKGIVHRDLKPENLFVTNDGRVKILDFGIAKLLRSDAGEGEGGATSAPTQTSAGVVLGTTGYMAPEQVRGEAVDQRADLFALGSVLYEMLASRRAFSGATPADTMSAILTQNPPPLSTLREGIAPDLDHAVRRCLEKNPRERFQAALDLSNALERLATGSARLESQYSPLLPLPAWMRRSSRWRRAITLGAAGLVALTIAVMTWKSGWRPGLLARANTVAVLPLRNLSEEPSESGFLVDGFGEQLANRLTDLKGLLVLPWLTTRGIDLERPFPAIAKELHTQVLVAGSYRADGDSLHVSITVIDGQTGYQRWARTFDSPMEDLLTVQTGLATSVAEQLKGRVSEQERSQLVVPAARNGEAWELYLRGSEYLGAGDPQLFSKAESCFDRALALDPRLAEAHVGLGAIHNALYFGQLGSGERDLEMSKEHFDKALAINPELIPALRGSLRIHFYRAEAEECLKIAQRAKAMGPQRIEALILAGEAFAFGRLNEEALPFLERASELDPSNPSALWNLVFVLQWAGQNERAFQTGVSYTKRFGEDIEIYLSMASAAAEMGRVSTSATLFDRAIAAGGAARDLRADESAAVSALRSGKPERARKILSGMVSPLEERLAAYPENARVRAFLIEVYALLGRRADVLRQLERLLPEISKPGYRDQSVPYVAVSLLYVGCLEQAKQVLDIMRRGAGIAGYYDEVLVWSSFPTVSNQPEFQRFRAEGVAALNRLRSKYGS